MKRRKHGLGVSEGVPTNVTRLLPSGLLLLSLLPGSGHEWRGPENVITLLRCWRTKWKKGNREGPRPLADEDPLQVISAYIYLQVRYLQRSTDLYSTVLRVVECTTEMSCLVLPGCVT